MSGHVANLPPTLVAYPGTGHFAQQVARTFFDADALQAFATTFAHREDDRMSRILARVPSRFSNRVTRELQRRAITEVPSDKVLTAPGWEVCRTVLSRLGAGPILVDRAWDRMAHHFDTWVASLLNEGLEAVYAYEYTALAAFTKARHNGQVRILDLPSLDSRAFEEVRRRELERFPELATPARAYFDRRYPERQARRDAEISAADIIVANSRLTMASHVKAGADPARFVVVPLAMPVPVGEDELVRTSKNAPLRVAWAGRFSLGKGAHYFLDAWRMIAAHRHSRVDVYGGVDLPARMIAPAPASLTFHGAIPQSELLMRLGASDVLVMPSLSDGFGMVVTEALSRGVPVIVSDGAGASDLIDPGRNGFVISAGDASAIADVLGWCFDNRAALADMRHGALASARAWQWSDYRRTLHERLRDALAARVQQQREAA